MKLSDLLDKNSIISNLRARDKKGALEEMVGKAAVIATGMHTEIGRIASLTQELREEPSPLQKELITDHPPHQSPAG